MRKIGLLLGALVFSTILAFAQPTPGYKRCATYESLQEFRALHPGAETDAQFEAWLAQKIQERSQSTQRTQAYYLIPIIFHVVHDGEAPGTGSNLSASQIQQQLNQLNADFANLSGSQYGVAADMQIQFCLATVNASGTSIAEAGIDRVDRNVKGWNAPPYDGLASNSYVDVTIMPNSIWDPTKFFNVWTLDLSGTLLGKATFPSSSGIADLPPASNDNATHSGVFVKYESVGSICSPGALGAAAGLGRTLTHESGHFFGLRHIWGDALCGNDFCADTPTQDDATSGCPGTGALNNCTPSGPKMFENYMDYTDDACVNTLTADQKTRMQTVMLNSPRRMQLPGAGSCTGAPANSIKFNYVCAQVAETGTVSTCPRYRDVSVNILVFSAANSNATLNFTKAGTATNNIDYTIIPSSISYINGDNLPKTVTIRIWDDAIAESSETLTLGYTITGSGVVAGSSNQTFTLTITDDDATPVIDNTGSITLLSQNFGTSGGAFPTGWLTGSFGPVSTNVWRVSSNGGAGITGQCAHITNNTTTKPLSYTATSACDAVLVTPAINSTGYSDIQLSFTYKCEGELAGSTLQDFGMLMYSFDLSSFFPINDEFGNPYFFYQTTPATSVNLPLPANLSNTTFYIGFRWINNSTVGTDPPFLIDDVVVSTPATQVESQVTNPGTENIFNNQDVYILSDADNQVMARIQNTNADIGCLTATLTQAGVTRVAVNTSAGSYLRTEKVIRITPAIANTAVTYQGTLYFTTAELNAWVVAGVPLNTLKILKVKDATSLGSTLNSSNSEIITPVFSDQSAAGYYAYTANFTGFSQFMLASPNISLPVELISFEAKAVRKTIVLNWSTSQEINNRGFAIERGTDGINFEKIGWVAGMINSNSRTDYNYTDIYVQPGIVYYYRLRQTDIDAREKLSITRQAKIDEAGVSLTVNPNPAKDQLSLFISGSAIPAGVRLVNMQGQVVRQWDRVNAYGAPVQLNITGLASGLYMLEVQLPSEKLVQKIMIK